MKLTDLAPKWWSLTDGTRVGISFACPVHAAGGIGETGMADCCLGRVWVRTETDGPGPRWHRTGDDFATMTLSPSVRCTIPQGVVHWHGFVQGGEVSVLSDSVGPAWP